MIYICIYNVAHSGRGLTRGCVSVNICRAHNYIKSSITEVPVVTTLNLIHGCVQPPPTYIHATGIELCNHLYTAQASFDEIRCLNVPCISETLVVGQTKGILWAE